MYSLRKQLLSFCVNCVVSDRYCYCCFSYHTLLKLQYGDKRHKSLATKEWAKEGWLSIWEMECCLDAELFLNEYPRWDVRGLHCPFIFQQMFIHAAESWQKEAERLIHHSCWQGLPRLDSEVDISTIQLVGTGHPEKKLGTSTTKYTYLRGCQDPHHAGPSGHGR